MMTMTVSILTSSSVNLKRVCFGLTVSKKYERALQMRLIGPHQGLRLERVRSKRENILEYDMVEQHNLNVDQLGKTRG